MVNAGAFGGNDTHHDLQSSKSDVVSWLFSDYSATILAASLFTVFLVKYQLSRAHSAETSLPPGPTRKWPVLGCLPEMWASGVPASEWIHRVMKDLGDAAGITCVRLGNTYFVAVSSPEIAREFLKKRDAVFASRPETMATKISSHGYLTAALGPGGDQWKKMRRMLVSEILSKSRLRWMLKERTQETDFMLRFIYDQCSKSSEGEVVNVKSIAMHIPANIIRRMVFGRRHFGTSNNDDVGGVVGPDEEKHVSAIFEILSYVYAFSVSDYLPWVSMFDLDGHQRKVREIMAVIQEYHYPIVKERVNLWKEEKRIEPEDFLDILISLKTSNGNPLLSVEEIQAQVLELFMASVDNLYNVVEWAMSELLNQPEMLGKAVDELDKVVGRNRLVQEADIPELPYVVGCAREALRLHPSAPFNLPHVASADCTVAGYFIPRGSSVILSRQALGRNPFVWDDPHRFNPERHLAEHPTDLAEPELRFISFTAGRRGCVGAGLGTSVTLLVLARLLQGFAWRVPDGCDKIDLTSAGAKLFKALPLHAHAKPRLDPSLYPSLSPHL